MLMLHTPLSPFQYAISASVKPTTQTTHYQGTKRKKEVKVTNYHDNGNRKSLIVTKYAKDGKTKTSMTTTNYNKEGQKTKQSKTTYHNNGKKKNTTVTVYKDHKVIKGATRDIKKYNTNGQLTSTTYQRYNGKKWVKDSQRGKMVEVQAILKKKYNKKNLGIYVYDLKNGFNANINGDKVFHTASTGKLPIMMYTQKLINEKKIDPNKKYEYTNKINTAPLHTYMKGGAGILQNKKKGTKYSIATILNWVAKYSGNQETNFLSHYVANDMDEDFIQYTESILGHKWTWLRASAKDNTLLLKEIYKNGGQLIKDMSNTIFDNQRLPKYLPNKVRVAHKTGDVFQLKHDCGIVYTKNPYIICVMTDKSNYETISQISKDVYQIMK